MSDLGGDDIMAHAMKRRSKHHHGGSKDKKEEEKEKHHYKGDKPKSMFGHGQAKAPGSTTVEVKPVADAKDYAGPAKEPHSGWAAAANKGGSGQKPAVVQNTNIEYDARFPNPIFQLNQPAPPTGVSYAEAATVHKPKLSSQQNLKHPRAVNIGELRQIAMGNEHLSNSLLERISEGLSTRIARDPHKQLHPHTEVVEMHVIINDAAPGAASIPIYVVEDQREVVSVRFKLVIERSVPMNERISPSLPGLIESRSTCKLDVEFVFDTHAKQTTFELDINGGLVPILHQHFLRLSDAGYLEHMGEVLGKPWELMSNRQLLALDTSNLPENEMP